MSRKRIGSNVDLLRHSNFPILLKSSIPSIKAFQLCSGEFKMGFVPSNLISCYAMHLSLPVTQYINLKLWINRKCCLQIKCVDKCVKKYPKENAAYNYWAVQKLTIISSNFKSHLKSLQTNRQTFTKTHFINITAQLRRWIQNCTRVSKSVMLIINSNANHV